MLRALWTAATGMNVQQTNLDVIANNIANVNTTAFKASRASFPGPDVPDAAAPGHQDRAGQPGSDGHPDRPRCKAGRRPEAIHPGGLPADGKPARPGDRGERLHADPDAVGRKGIYQGGLVPDGRRGEDMHVRRVSARPEHHHTPERHVRHGRDRRHRLGPDTGPDRRSSR